jgi:hypothetical protein
MGNCSSKFVILEVLKYGAKDRGRSCGLFCPRVVGRQTLMVICSYQKAMMCGRDVSVKSSNGWEVMA